MTASLRARLAYEKAHGLDAGKQGWAKDVLAACTQQTKACEAGRTQARWKSFTYGVLPSIFGDLGIEIAGVVQEQSEAVRKWLQEPRREVSVISPTSSSPVQK